MANLNLPLFSNTIADPTGWVNQVTRSLSAVAFSPVELLTGAPVPTLGKIFLIGTGASLPLVSGDVLVYTTLTVSGYQTFTPIDGTVVGGYTRKTTASTADWVQTEFANGAVYVAGAPGTIAVPTAFKGICDVVVPFFTPVTFTSTLANGGLMGTALTSGVYRLFQDSTKSILS
jgi:hypothetical protein